MKTAKAILSENNRLVKKKRPIKPLLPTDFLFKPKRVLTTPLDILLLKGLLSTNPPVIGTFAYGSLMDSTEITDPVEASVFPINCRNFPLIEREGYAATLTTIPKEQAKPTATDVKLPEFYYIYQLVLNTIYRTKGSTLVIGGNGLQTRLLAFISNKNIVFTGVTPKQVGRTKARIIGKEKLKDTSWDTIIVWTIDVDKATEVLGTVSSRQLLFHPFTACLHKRISIPIEKHKYVDVLHPTRLIEVERQLEKIVSQSREYISINYDEVGPTLDYLYMTIVMKE